MGKMPNPQSPPMEKTGCLVTDFTNWVSWVSYYVVVVRDITH